MECTADRDGSMANLIITNYCNADCDFCFAADSRRKMLKGGMRQMSRDEVRGDLIPAVEAKYSTYAPTVDAEGFAASRDHRCISGYSQGSGACWNVSYKVLDWAKWIMPMSGNSVNNLDRLKEALTESGISASDIFVILCSGGKRDMAYEGTVALANAMIADEAFSFGSDPVVNNCFAEISNDMHTTINGRTNLFNAVQDVLFK